MLVSMSEIMNEKQGVRKINTPIELTSFKMMGMTYGFHQKDSVELILTNMGNRKIHIEAKSRVVLEVPCDRCLKNALVPISIKVSNELDFNKTEEQRVEDLDETNYVTGYDLDVDKLIYEEILIGFPMKVLCKDDCKGICKICGADLNFGECGCDRTEFNPRMSVIQDIFNKFKEV